MNSRRDFLKQAGLAAAGAMILPSLSGFKPVKKVGLQLYNFRSQLSTEVKVIIPKIAKAGYKEVETYGYSVKDKFWGLEPKAFKKLLDANGLTAPSGHYGIDTFISTGSKEELQHHIEAANAIGTKYLIVPWIGEPLRKNADDWKKISDRLNEASVLCKSNDLKLGYHNHDFEFDNLGTTTGYNLLLQNIAPDAIHFELDLYWTIRSGVDPLELFKAHPGRFPFWHVKDMDKSNHNINTEIGKGAIDYKTLYKEGAKLSGLKHLIVEQENFTIDPFVSIKQSADYIKKELY